MLTYTMPDTFPDHSQDPSQSQSQQASPTATRAPLLDHNETNLLQTFFENPNNIDPTFLALSQERQDSDLYGAASSQWIFGPLRQDQGAHIAQSQHHGAPVQIFGPQQGTSEDVLNAAKVLHAHQSAYNASPFSPSGFVDSPHASQTQMYGYPSHQVPQSAYHSSSSSQASPTNQSTYGPMMPNRPVAVHRPAPLNFGSDNKFENSKYVPSNMHKPPDQDLIGMLSGFSQDQGESVMQPPDSSGSSKQKRRRPSDADGDSDDEPESSYKRGKHRFQDEEDGINGNNAITSCGPRERASSMRGHKPPSPTQRRRSSPVGRKPPRENLTEEQKRSNHIQSEQKRRNLIKLGFEDTNRMVPELRAGGFSKSNMLQEAAKFMRDLQKGNDQLSDIIGILDKG